MAFKKMSIASLLPNGLPEYWIYSVNVSYDLDDDQIKSFFAQCGQIVGFQYVLDRNGSKKGHIRIAYRKKNEAIRALAELHNTKFNGRIVKLNWDKGMVLKNVNAPIDRISDLLKKSETDRSISFSLYNENCGFDPDNYVNTNQSPYKKTLGTTIDRTQTSPYELLYTKKIDPINFPFLIPKNT